MLDEAGWTIDGDVRKKDGVELEDQLRHHDQPGSPEKQAVVKSTSKTLGFKVELQQVDAACSSIARPETNRTTPTCTGTWTCSPRAGRASADCVHDSVVCRAGRRQYRPGGERLVRPATPSDTTTRSTTRSTSRPVSRAIPRSRSSSSSSSTTSSYRCGVLPLVRVGDKQALVTNAEPENIAPSPYEYDYWNIANWNRVKRRINRLFHRFRFPIVGQHRLQPGAEPATTPSRVDLRSSNSRRARSAARDEPRRGHGDRPDDHRRGSMEAGDMGVIPIGIIAGLMASVEAAKAHETPQAPPTKPAAQGGAGAGDIRA